jgi:zinc/manganese transport system ATP-binding protein
MTTPVLSLEHATLRFGDRRILDDVSFSINRGEFTGLIGSNGVGKTTLLRVLLGLQPLDSGEVRLDEASAPTLGYVPQKIALDPDLPLRARDFIALGIDGHRFGLGRRSAKDKQLVETMIDAVNARAFADRRIGELSGGEQQRVFIAHALVGQPSVLLLDEPLANLDPKSVQEVVTLLHRIATEHHVAIFLSAHEMNALLPVMDRIVYLADGRAASGTTAEVIKPDVLSKLYGHHVDVLQLHGRVLVVTEPGEENEGIAEHADVTVLS